MMAKDAKYGAGGIVTVQILKTLRDRLHGDKFCPFNVADGVLLRFPNVDQANMLTTIQSGPELRGSNFQGDICHAASLPIQCFRNPHQPSSRPMPLLYLLQNQSPVLMESI